MTKPPHSPWLPNIFMWSNYINCDPFLVSPIPLTMLLSPFPSDLEIVLSTLTLVGSCFFPNPCFHQSTTGGQEDIVSKIGIEFMFKLCWEKQIPPLRPPITGGFGLELYWTSGGCGSRYKAKGFKCKASSQGEKERVNKSLVKCGFGQSVHTKVS